MNGFRRGELAVVSSMGMTSRWFHGMYLDIKLQYHRLRRVMISADGVERIKLRQSSYSGTFNPPVVPGWPVTYQELMDSTRLLQPPPVVARITPLMFIRQMMASEVIPYNPRYPGKSKRIQDYLDMTKEQVLGTLRVPVASFTTF
jgi:hypothetical protein